MPGTWVELSHRIVSGMSVAPQLPSPRVEPYISHAASRSTYGGQAEFEITRLFLVGNSGTTIDSPYHRFPERCDVSALPLERLVDVPGVRLEADGRRRNPGGLSVDSAGISIRGRAVLIHTGWDRRWGTERYWTEGPWLARPLVERLVEARPALVGVDCANVDDREDLSRPAHTMLLEAGIPILENLRGLDQLPESGFRLFAPPLQVTGASALPVRAFARLKQGRGRSGS